MGSEVGLDVGNDVGDDVGVFVVGCRVGKRVGLLVGVYVGDLLSFVKTATGGPPLTAFIVLMALMGEADGVATEVDAYTKISRKTSEVVFIRKANIVEVNGGSGGV